MVKIIWLFICLNTLALLLLVGAYFFHSAGRPASYEEKGWTIVLSIFGMVTILLAAVPLRFNQSTGTLIFSGIFAFLPLLLILFIALVK